MLCQHKLRGLVKLSPVSTHAWIPNSVPLRTQIILWLVKTWAKDIRLDHLLRLVRFTKKIAGIVGEADRSLALPIWPAGSVLGAGVAGGGLKNVMIVRVKARPAFLAWPGVKLAREEAGNREMWGRARFKSACNFSYYSVESFLRNTVDESTTDGATIARRNRHSSLQIV